MAVNLEQITVYLLSLEKKLPLHLLWCPCGLQVLLSVPGTRHRSSCLVFEARSCSTLILALQPSSNLYLKPRTVISCSNKAVPSRLLCQSGIIIISVALPHCRLVAVSVRWPCVYFFPRLAFSCSSSAPDQNPTMRLYGRDVIGRAGAFRWPWQQHSIFGKRSCWSAMALCTYWERRRMEKTCHSREASQSTRKAAHGHCVAQDPQRAKCRYHLRATFPVLHFRF